MKKTQLQMRIESSVGTGQSYGPETFFIDLESGDYRNQPFIDEKDFIARYLSEEKVKSADTYEELRPAIQARLAYMEFAEEFIRVLNHHRNSKTSKLEKRLRGRLRILEIQWRNDRLKKKAVNRAIKRNGGLKHLIIMDFAKRVPSLMERLGTLNMQSYLALKNRS